MRKGHPLRALRLLEWLIPYLPGFFLGFSVVSWLYSMALGTAISPVAIVAAVAGCIPFIVAKVRKPAGVSSVMLRLQGGAKRKVHARSTHSSAPTAVITRYLQGFKGKAQMRATGMILSIAAAIAIYAVLVSLLLPFACGLQLFLQLVPIAAMLYLLRETSYHQLRSSVVLAAFAIPLTLPNPIAGILAALCVFAFCVERAHRKGQFHLLPIGAVSIYLSLLYWLIVDQSQPAVVLLILQALSVVYLVVLASFMQRRRVLEERMLALSVLGLNALAYLSLSVMALLASGLIGGEILQPSWLLFSVLATSGASAIFSWLTFKEYSYAKYFVLAGLGAVVFVTSLILGVGEALTQVWLVLALVLFAAARLTESQTMRLAGVGAAVLSAALWMAALMAGSSTLSLQWTGLLIAASMLLIALYPPKSAGILSRSVAQQEERIVLQLTVLAAVLLGVGSMTTLVTVFVK